MKKNRSLALTAFAASATLAALTLASCGGGDDSAASSSSGTPAAATASPEGIWTGTLRSSVTNKNQTATLIVLPTGEMRMLWNNCVQLVATTTTSSNFYSGSGNAYAPDGTIAACPTAVTFPNGTSVATLSVSGQVNTASTLIGTYSAGGDSGSYNLAYSAAYARVGTIARLVGNYSNGTLALTIDGNGSITGTMGTTTLTGTVTTIDPTKNAYRVSLIETITTPGTTTASTSTSASDTTTTTTSTSTSTTTALSGLATLIDYSTGTDNYLLVSVTGTIASTTGGTGTATGFAVPLVRQ